LFSRAERGLLGEGGAKRPSGSGRAGILHRRRLR